MSKNVSNQATFFHRSIVQVWCSCVQGSFWWWIEVSMGTPIDLQLHKQQDVTHDVFWHHFLHKLFQKVPCSSLPIFPALNTSTSRTDCSRSDYYILSSWQVPLSQDNQFYSLQLSVADRYIFSSTKLTCKLFFDPKCASVLNFFCSQACWSHDKQRLIW